MTSTAATPTAAISTAGATIRQQVLVLYLNDSALDSPVRGWSVYDGAAQGRPTTGDGIEAPYETGLDALKDGWRLFQASQLIPPIPGHEHDTSFLKHEFWFERLADVETKETDV